MPTHTILLLIFTAATSIAVLIQLGFILALALVGFKTAKKAEKLMDEINVHLKPTIAATRHIVEDLVPKLRTVTEDVTVIAAQVRHQAEHVNSTVDEVVDKTRVQAERVDEMVTNVLNSVVQASSTIQHGIDVPMRRISGLLSGIRAGVDTFRNRPAVTHRPEEDHSF